MLLNRLQTDKSHVEQAPDSPKKVMSRMIYNDFVGPTVQPKCEVEPRYPSQLQLYPLMANTARDDQLTMKISNKAILLDDEELTTIIFLNVPACTSGPKIVHVV